mmetsp:Transcript_18320/g.48354  ORF Transcript_18320/g.48354 Transcript_18320/m.48354 type:complete len:675 (-) Transcript_18320:108-2132(-)
MFALLLGLLQVVSGSPYREAPLAWSFSAKGLELATDESAVNHAFLNSNWLRERTQMRGYVDEDSLQPLLDPHEVGDVYLTNVTSSGSNGDQTLFVEFSDDASWEFLVDALLFELQNERHSCTQTKDTTCVYPDVYLWNASLEMPPIVDYSLLEESPVEHAHFVHLLMTTGLILVDNVPKREGFCTDFGSRLSTLRTTEWGLTFNVRAQPDVQPAAGNATTATKFDLAYTSGRIGLHTDNPYRDPMPDFQLLHQIDGCDCAGQSDARGRPLSVCEDCRVENYFADGMRAAVDLKEADPEAFELLSTIPVRWENNGGDGSSSLVSNHPHIELQHELGAKCIFAHCIRTIRFSAKSGGYAPLLPVEQAERFYAARRKFSAMLHSDDYKLTLSMKPGQLLIFDNQRVLHSRSAIHSPKVARFVQGCYINRDGLWYSHIKASKNRPRYASLKAASKSDFQHIGEAYREHVDERMVDTLFGLLGKQKHADKSSLLGQPVDLHDHQLQTASRAYRNGEDVDTVVMSLLHDVSESVIAKNHGSAAAALLEPYLSPKALWMLRHHEIFQMYYYAHFFDELTQEEKALKVDQDPTGERLVGRVDRRQQCCAGHRWYADLERWCELYDQASFDPGYPALPLAFFRPMAEQVLLKRKPFWHTPGHPLASAVTGDGGSVKHADASEL